VRQQTTQTTDLVGGRIETRTIIAIPFDLKLQGFGAIRQVFSINRIRESKKTGKITEETVYGGHTQPIYLKSPADVLAESRAHWVIENKEHYVRDVTFNEDKSKIRTGNGAHMMAILRNMAINILRSREIKNMRKSTQEFSHCASKLLNFLGISPLTLKAF
jgi:predicted transposase YbfD/YdcC